MKFLIDECLSPVLAEIAANAGYPESAPVTHRGMARWKDHRLMKVIIPGDWTFVTQDSDDFRPRPGSTSAAPCYVGVPLHSGLVCLNLPSDARRPDHEMYFRAALGSIGNPGDLVNKILEVDPDPASPGKVVTRTYDFP